MSDQCRLDLIITTLESRFHTLNGEVAQVLEQVRGVDMLSEESLETLVQSNKKLDELLELLKDIRGELKRKMSSKGREDYIEREYKDIEREDEDIKREDEDKEIREFKDEDGDIKRVIEDEDNYDWDEALAKFDVDEQEG
jgi:ATP-dependent Lon protease